VSESDTVAARTPEEPVVLTDLAHMLLSEASSSGSGTAAISLTPAEHKTFTQTVVAVVDGHELDAQHWNGPASVQVVTGAATVSASDGGDTELGSGQWATLRAGSGSIRADEDTVLLLTVVPD
jgi:hypothetical protein